ncbi:unnamed protein product [Didymodactylos carnosus]|uniref:Uncharacterized protein n=1 Tax=Didymodactylos carnosus TaxID=1234261 RepID=A0A816AG85_9BILA|nr:unnamed protein product [Didymodactylos carnosus]CAF4469889.1 unnamed protein product [Didymodactylos carnosus]
MELQIHFHLQDILCAIHALIRYLTRIKTNEYFTIFYEDIRAEAKSLTDESSLPRARKLPARFIDSLPIATHHETVYDLYHHQYFEVIDKIINSLNSRFKQSACPLLCKVEQFILSTANGTKDSDDEINLNDMNEFLVGAFDIERLKRELVMLPDYFSTVNKGMNLG